jgi:hypothetical protein
LLDAERTNVGGQMKMTFDNVETILEYELTLDDSVAFALYCARNLPTISRSTWLPFTVVILFWALVIGFPFVYSGGSWTWAAASIGVFLLIFLPQLPRIQRRLRRKQERRRERIIRNLYAEGNIASNVARAASGSRKTELRARQTYLSNQFAMRLLAQ